jgi:hypothetical protein
VIFYYFIHLKFIVSIKMLLSGQQLEGNRYYVNKFGSPSFHFLTSESAALAPESMCDYSAAILEEQQQKHILLPCHARFHKEDVQKKKS